MANFVFVPQIFDGFINHLWLSRKEFIWVREDAVVNTSRRRVMLTSLHVALIDAILEQKNNPGDYFGVAFSVYHCAIVKVVKDACTTTFSHMTTPQFLSSLPADSPSTPGITIPARLGYRIDPAPFVCVMELCGSGDGKWRNWSREIAHSGN
jgi:hypothetical protein